MAPIAIGPGRIWHHHVAPRMRLETIGPALFLGAIIAYALHIFLAPTILLPWYANTEEFPYIQEILRFSGFDFRQQFFDIPGTPLMALGTLLWWLYYLSVKVLDPAQVAAGISEFSFGHLQELYVVLRITSALFFSTAIVLTYLLAKRLMNAAGGYLAATILAFHPILGGTVYHLRIEPMTVATVLFAVWLVLRAGDNRSYWLFFASGAIAGACLGVRYPSLLASFPVILAFAILRLEDFHARRRLNLGFLAAIGTVFFSGGVLALLLRVNVVSRGSGTDQLLMSFHAPNLNAAVDMMQKIWMAAGLLCVLTLCLCMVFRGSAAIRRLPDSQVPVVLMGCLTGAMVSVPTVLWQRNYFLSSVQMFVDRNKEGLRQASGFLDTVQIYLFGLFGEPKKVFFNLSAVGQPYSLANGVCISAAHVVLLGAGVAVLTYLVVRHRQTLLLPSLIGAAVGLVSQYGKAQSTRHIAAWLSYFAMLMALPVAAAYQRQSRGHRLGAAVFVGAAIGGLVYLSHQPIRDTVIPRIDFYLEKTELSARMDRWFDEGARKDLRSFHVCCEVADAEVIFSWMRSNGVSIPGRFTDEGPKRVIWFGDKGPLVAAACGYIVINRNTYKGFYIDYYNHVDPRKIVDPFTDRRFELVKEISGPRNTWQIYEFNFGDGDCANGDGSRRGAAGGAWRAKR